MRRKLVFFRFQVRVCFGLLELQLFLLRGFWVVLVERVSRDGSCSTFILSRPSVFFGRHISSSAPTASVSICPLCPSEDFLSVERMRNPDFICLSASRRTASSERRPPFQTPHGSWSPNLPMKHEARERHPLMSCCLSVLQVLSFCPKDMRADICVHLNRKVRDRVPARGPGLASQPPGCLQVDASVVLKMSPSCLRSRSSTSIRPSG